MISVNVSKEQIVIIGLIVLVLWLLAVLMYLTSAYHDLAGLYNDNCVITTRTAWPMANLSFIG